jgi:hypothetical protein
MHADVGAPLLLLQGKLTFTALRLAMEGLDLSASSSMEMPSLVALKLYEMVAVVAMQFGGYIYKVHQGQVRRVRQAVLACTTDRNTCTHLRCQSAGVK